MLFVQANTANASLSAEVQQLQAALDEASGRLAESQAAAKVAMDELAAVKDALQLLRYFTLFTTSTERNHHAY